MSQRTQKFDYGTYSYELTQQVCSYSSQPLLHLLDVAKSCPKCDCILVRGCIYPLIYLDNVQEISRERSFSHASRPACAKTFRLGFRPTASRFDVALTRNVRRKRIRGCVTWSTRGADFGKGI